MSAKSDADALAAEMGKNISAAMASSSKFVLEYEGTYLTSSVKDSSLLKDLMKRKAERGLRG